MESPFVYLQPGSKKKKKKELQKLRRLQRSEIWPNETHWHWDTKQTLLEKHTHHPGSGSAAAHQISVWLAAFISAGDPQGSIVGPDTFNLSWFDWTSIEGNQTLLVLGLMMQSNNKLIFRFRVTDASRGSHLCRYELYLLTGGQVWMCLEIRHSEVIWPTCLSSISVNVDVTWLTLKDRPLLPGLLEIYLLYVFINRWNQEHSGLKSDFI